MTAVKDSVLYKTLKKAVRKEDHAELLRMLEMVPIEACNHWGGFDAKMLVSAFGWGKTPQGIDYWDELSLSLMRAGHDCW